MRVEIKIIEIRGCKKDHLARCDEFGDPKNKTFCGLTYDSMDRTGNRPVHAKNGNECKMCISKFNVIRYPLRRVRRIAR
jgi:hypothetical protein